MTAFFAAFFTPFEITGWQLLFIGLAAAGLGWIAAARLLDKIEWFGLHTKCAGSDSSSLHAVLDALCALFADHRVLMWRYAVCTGKPRGSRMAMHSTVSLARAYTVLRAHGRTPSTAEWPEDRRRDTDAPTAHRPATGRRAPQSAQQ